MAADAAAAASNAVLVQDQIGVFQALGGGRRVQTATVGPVNRPQ